MIAIDNRIIFWMKYLLFVTKSQTKTRVHHYTAFGTGVCYVCTLLLLPLLFLVEFHAIFDSSEGGDVT